MKICDISAWQPSCDIDWNRFSKEFDGVILKIGQGGHLDDEFIDHVNNAVAHGMKYGVYYYNTATDSAKAIQEAKYVDYWIKTYLNGVNPELGIWADVEDDVMLKGNTTEIALTFINYLWGLGYNYVGLYSSYNWLANGYLDKNLILSSGVGIWVANYSSKNYLAEEHPEYIIAGWQYTDHYSEEFPYDASIFYKN